MTPAEQTAIGIIGGADGPTTVFVSNFPISLVIVGIAAVIGIAIVVALVTKNR